MNDWKQKIKSAYFAERSWKGFPQWWRFMILQMHFKIMLILVVLVVMVMVMVVVMIWDKSVIWCFFLRPLLIKDKDNLIIFQVTAKLFHSIEKLPCASLTMTWTKRWRTRCIEYAGQAQQSRPSGKFLKEIVRTVLLSGSAFCGPEKYDIGERVKRDVPNIHILDILRYHDEPIEWCFLGFGLNWEWV